MVSFCYQRGCRFAVSILSEIDQIRSECLHRYFDRRLPRSGENNREEEAQIGIMGFSIASPNEEKIHDSKSSVQEAVKSGFKTAVLCASAAAVPTLIGCRTIPWAKANLNHTAQALIISAAGVAGFFITADRTILENARGNTIGKHDK